MTQTLRRAAVGSLLVLAACGANNSSTAKATRTIEVTMVDTDFKPKTIKVRGGETIRFRFTNAGKVAHDAYIGDEAAQKMHETEMRGATAGEHGGGHDSDTGALTVEPGKTGELSHTFTTGDRIEIGCHQPGHYAAGMRIAIEVT